MYSVVTKQADGCDFQWKIENVSLCLLKEIHQLDSSTFVADALGNSKWRFNMFHIRHELANYFSVRFIRDSYSLGPEKIEVSSQFAFLGKDGSLLMELDIYRYRIPRDGRQIRQDFHVQENILLIGNVAFPLENTLTVKCTIWESEVKPATLKHFYARTVFKENRGSFAWRINKLSNLKHDVRKKFKHSLIDFDLVLNEEIEFEKKLVININSFDESIQLFTFTTFIVDSEGKKENCGRHEYSAEVVKKGILPLSECQLNKKLMENKSRYLTNDALSLDCEYIVLTTRNLYEFFDSRIISPKSTNDVDDSWNEDYVGKAKYLSTSVLNDLKVMYSDAIFSDTELRTSTRNFPAHKNILSARSPVFRSMFSNDMKEKNAGHVDITDFEEDTVHRMLLYIYTDNLEDMQFESASNLYAIGDKYEILSMRRRCSSYLKENLCPANTCDVLVLADLHNDDDLKSFVEDYIVAQKKQFFCSQEWKHFMNIHIKLAADVMHRKIYQE